MEPLPQKGLGAPRFLVLTTSRAHPNKDGSLEEHLAADPRAPFHVWLDSSGKATIARSSSDFVLPDGVEPNPASLEICAQAEVACLGGLFWSLRTQTPGTNPLPLAISRVSEYIVRWCSERGRAPWQALVGAWELGAEAYASEVLVGLVRSLRGDAPYAEAPNANLVLGPPLTAVRDQRAVLRAHGFAVSETDVNDRWMAADQRALLEFQRRLGVRATGWWDSATVAAARGASSLGR